MPPSGFSKRAVEGALIFIQTCYEDLQDEVKQGKHPSFEAAIEHELTSIRKALSRLHIDKDGNLVKR
jgi:hypothetical protein